MIRARFVTKIGLLSVGNFVLLPSVPNVLMEACTLTTILALVKTVILHAALALMVPLKVV